MGFKFSQNQQSTSLIFIEGSHKKIVIIKIVEPDANKIDGQYFGIKNTFKTILHKRL